MGRTLDSVGQRKPGFCRPPRSKAAPFQAGTCRWLSHKKRRRQQKRPVSCTTRFQKDASFSASVLYATGKPGVVISRTPGATTDAEIAANLQTGGADQSGPVGVGKRTQLTAASGPANNCVREL
jgi:hypothetical protein